MDSVRATPKRNGPADALALGIFGMVAIGVTVGDGPAVTERSASSSGKRALAVLVAVGGALAVWAFANARQDGETEAVSRQWVGDQWDVARACLTGTPIGRGQSEDEIASYLGARLVDTIVSASESDEELDENLTWPARCLGPLSSLRVEPGLVGGDPSDALNTLEVLIPRVLPNGPEGPTRFTVGLAADRARELAEPIARLDEMMPDGSEYDVAEYDDAAPATQTAALASLVCPTPRPARRPFLRAGLGDERLADQLEDGDASFRITSTDGTRWTLSRTDANGIETTPLDRTGFPRFFNRDREIVWLEPDAFVLDDAPLAPRPGVAGDAMALCRRHDVVHFFVGSADSVSVLRYEFPDSTIASPVAVRPTPPVESTVLGCDETTAIALWVQASEDRRPRWHGAVCRDGACARTEPLDAGGDLQLEVRAGVVHVVARARRTDLSLVRTLEGTEWSEAVPVARGTLMQDQERLWIEACEGIETRWDRALGW